MVVPSLNTVAEDDFRAFCPDDVAYHVHRIRLRALPGPVTMDDLVRAYQDACDAAALVADPRPDAVVFNCTGASAPRGTDGDAALAARMTERLGIPATNTMVAVKQALRAVRARDILHICPFTDTFSRAERASLEGSGITVRGTVSLDFADAKDAARMAPADIAEYVRGRIDDAVGAVLLSCANVRAFEAVEHLERAIGRPVVTSNQAVLWAVLAAAGRTGGIPGAGRLFREAAADVR
jgi:maleate isomerase